MCFRKQPFKCHQWVICYSLVRKSCVSISYYLVPWVGKRSVLYITGSTLLHRSALSLRLPRVGWVVFTKRKLYQLITGNVPTSSPILQYSLILPASSNQIASYIHHSNLVIDRAPRALASVSFYESRPLFLAFASRRSARRVVPSRILVHLRAIGSHLSLSSFLLVPD